MMTRDQLDQAQKLSRRIKLLEADLEEYRKAETFVVGLNKSKMGPGNLLFANQHTFPAAVIGGTIIAVVEQEVQALKDELRRLGVKE